MTRDDLAAVATATASRLVTQLLFTGDDVARRLNLVLNCLKR